MNNVIPTLYFILYKKFPLRFPERRYTLVSPCKSSYVCVGESAARADGFEPELVVGNITVPIAALATSLVSWGLRSILDESCL